MGVKVLTMDELKKFTKLNNSKLLKTKIVDALPTSNQDPAVIYLVKNTTDGYSDFMFVNGAWERFGESLIVLEVYKENNHIKVKLSNGAIVDAGEVIDAELQAQINDIQSQYEHFFQLGCDFKTAISDAITAKDNKVVIVDPVNATRDQFVNAIGAIVAGGGSSPDLVISPIKSASIASAQTNMNNGSIIFNIDVDNTVGYYDGVEIYIGETTDTSRLNGNTLIYSGKENQPMVSIETLYPYPANTNSKTIGFSGGYCVYYYPDYSAQKELYFRVYTYRSYGDEKKYNETSVLLKTDRVPNDSITLSSNTVYRKLKEYYYFTSSVSYSFNNHLIPLKCVMDLFLVGGGGTSAIGTVNGTAGGGGGYTLNAFDILFTQKSMYVGIGGSDSITTCIYNGGNYFAAAGNPAAASAISGSGITYARVGGNGGSGGGTCNTTAETASSAQFNAGNGGSDGGIGGASYTYPIYAKGQNISQRPFYDASFPPYGGGGGGADCTTDQWRRPGAGGATGGGNGGCYQNTTLYDIPQHGSPNTGGGAGGGGTNATYTPARSGGSGLVILRIA